MSIQRQPEQPRITWRDLPVSDGVPMDNNNHPIQAQAYLIEPLRRYLHEHGMEAFLGHNSFVWYQTEPPRQKGPDFYVVNGGHSDHQGSWVVPAEQGLYPSLIGELLSKSTEKADRTTKKDFYQDHFKTLDYFIYDTEDQRFEAWHLVDGVYRPVVALPSGRIRCQSLPLELGVHGKWLRWFTPDGVMLPTDTERSDAEHLRAEGERQRAEAERQRADAEHQRADAEHQRGDAERQRVEAERQQAEAERRRAENAEVRERGAQEQLERERQAFTQQRQQIGRQLLASGMDRTQVLEITELSPDQLPD